jgi:hypothetical protein
MPVLCRLVFFLAASLADPLPAAAQSGGTVVARDEFARVDAPDLGASETGQPWVRFNGAAGVAGNMAAFAGFFSLYALDTAVAAADVSVTIVQPNQEFWLILRFSDGGNYWRFGRSAGEPYQLQMVRGYALDVPDVETTSTRLPAVGDVLTCRVHDPGIECGVNGVPVVRTTNPFNRTATSVGLSSAEAPGALFDNLVVTTLPSSHDFSVQVAGPAFLAAGGEAAWTATVRNVGSVATESGTVVVSVPPALSGVLLSGLPCAPSTATTFTCDMPALSPGQSRAVTVAGTAPLDPGPILIAADVPPGAAESTTINNHGERSTIVRSPHAGPVVVFDEFARADAGDLGTADSGQVWTRYYGAAGVAAGQALLGPYFALVALDSGVAPSEVSVFVVRPTSEFWMVFRLTDGGNYWRFGRSADESYQLQLVRANTLQTPAAQVVSAVSASAGDTLRCALGDSVIECFVNGTLVARTTDTFNRTARSVGLSSSQNASAHFDDLLVVAPPPAPDLSAAITGPASATAGAAITWVATIRNVGEAGASTGEVAITLPAGISAVSFSGAVCTAAATSYSCPVGSLAVGQSRSITIQATAPSMVGPALVDLLVGGVAGELIGSNNQARATTRIRAATEGPIVLLDEFTRVGALGLGIADSGQQWLPYYGQSMVANEQAILGGFFTVTAVDTGIAAKDISISVVQPTAEFWLLFRFTDGGNYWRFGRWAGEPYQLQRIRAHTISEPGVVAHTVATAAPGDVLACQLRDSSITCSVNGTLVASTTDSFNRAATYVGLSSSQSAGAFFDDLVVSAPPPSPDFSTKMTGPPSLGAGATGVWTATVANVGTLVSPQKTFFIALPAGFTNVTLSGVACQVATGATFSCVAPPLNIGQQISVAVTATAPTMTGPVAVHVDVPPVAGELSASNNHAQRNTTIRATAAGAVVVLDEFARADAAALGVADSGQLWTGYFGAAGTLGEQAALGGFFTLMALDAGIAASDISVTVTEPTAEFWLTFRLTDGGNYWRFGRWAGEPYQLQMVRQHTLSAPGVQTFALQPASPGDVLACKLRDWEIECGVNGTVIARTANTFNSSATRVGLSSSQSAGGYFDDLMVSVPPPQADLKTRVTGPAMLTVAAAATWKVSVTNIGTAAAAPSTVAIGLSSGFTGASVTGGTCVATASAFTCSVSSLGIGASAEVTIHATAPAAIGPAAVTASLTASGDEATTFNNTAQRTTTLRPVGAPPVLVLDEFARANQNTLGTADSGQPWTRHYGVIGVDVEQAALGGHFNLTSVDSGAAASDVSVTVVESTAEFWLVLRFSDAENYWRFGRWGSGSYTLQRVRANTVEAPTTVEIVTTHAPAAGDVIRCEVRYRGIDCWVNDLLVARTTDAFNRAATAVGLSSSQNAGGRFDDLLVLAAPPGPELRLTMKASSWLLPSEIQDLRFVVRNTGQAASAESAATVALPSGTPLAAALPPGCVSGVVIMCAIPSLDPGESHELRFSVSSSTVGTVQGTASLHLPGIPSSLYDAAVWTTSVRTNPAGVSDRFARADTGSGLGSSPNGSAWQSVNGDFRIVDQTAVPTSPGSLAVVDRGFAFGTLDVILGDDAANAGIAFRVVDAANFYQLTTDARGYYWMSRMVNGEPVDVQYQVQRRLVKPRNGDHIRIVLRPDDSVFVAVNGQHVVDGGDVRDMFVTRWGLIARSGAATYHEFVLRPEMEALPLADNFDLSDGGWLGRPSSGVLYSWVPWVGDYWRTLGQRAHPTTAGYSYTAIEASSELATAKVVLAAPGTAAWLVFRHTEDGTYFRFGHDGATYDVSYVNLHVPTNMPAAVERFGTVVATAGDRLEVRQGTDGTVECFVNDVLVIRFVDPVHSVHASGYGLAAVGTGTLFDDFSVTPPSW